MALLDQFGRPIPGVRELREHRTRATLAGVRPAVSLSQAAGLTPTRLAAIHRDAAEGDGLAYLELAEDIEERDLHYAAVLGTRKRQVAQLPIVVEAVSDAPEHQAHQALVEAWIETGTLEEALPDILDAVGKGFSVCEITWQTEPGAFWPKKLHWLPQRWFSVASDDRDTLRLRDGATLDGTELSPLKFLVHRHPVKSGLVLRSGLARLASWAWMWKAFTLRDWAVFVQNYGQPLRVGRYGPEASDADRDTLWTAVSNIAGDCAAIIPKGMEIEFITGVDLKDGSDLYERRADWMDRQISKAVLGQTTTTDAISGGHAVAQEHRLVQEDIERADARMLSTTINRQLVQAIVALNFGPQPAYPRLRIGRPDEVPIAVVVDAVAKLAAVGLRVEASQIRDRLGLSEPGAGAEVIGRDAGAGLASPPAGGAPGVRPAPPASGGNAGGAGRPDPEEDGDQPSEGDPTREALAARAAAEPAMLNLRALLAAEPAMARHMDRLTERLADDARDALAGLTAAVRAEIEAATDMTDLAQRLLALDLDPRGLAEAMGRAAALAHLTGRAALLDELRG